jgi:hypothetical protein
VSWSDFGLFPRDLHFNSFNRLDRNPPQLADQPVGRFCIMKFVGDSQSANHLQVRAVLLASAGEHDVVEFVAGDGERMVEAAMGWATRFPRVMPKLSRFTAAFSQSVYEIRHTIAHDMLSPCNPVVGKGRRLVITVVMGTNRPFP